MKWQNTQRKHRQSTEDRRQKTAAKESGKQQQKKKKENCILNCCKCFTVFTQPSLSSPLLSSLFLHNIYDLSFIDFHLVFFHSSMWMPDMSAVLYVLWYLMCYSASLSHFLSLLLHAWQFDNTEIYFHSSWIIRVSSQSIICIFEIFTVSNLCTVKRSVDKVFQKKENKWQLLIGFKRGTCHTVPWGTVD